MQRKPNAELLSIPNCVVCSGDCEIVPTEFYHSGKGRMIYFWACLDCMFATKENRYLGLLERRHEEWVIMRKVPE